MTLDDVGRGVTTQRCHNNGRLIMLEVNCIKFSLDIHTSLGIIMCKFHTFQSKTEGMAAPVHVFLEHPVYLCFLKGETPFKMHKIIFFPEEKKKNMCAYPT